MHQALYVPTVDTKLLHFLCLEATKEQKGNCISAKTNKPDYLIPSTNVELWLLRIAPKRSCGLMVIAFKTVENRCTGDPKCIVNVSVTGCVSHALRGWIQVGLYR